MEVSLIHSLVIKIQTESFILMKKLNHVQFYAILIGFAVLSGCDKTSDPAPVVTTLSPVTFANLSADPPSGGYNPTNGQPIGVTNKYTFFRFASGSIVANTDSATTKWDVGFKGTTLIINSGTSGPGTAGAQVIEGIFADLATAPDAGYRQDDKNSADPLAIVKGSGQGWYNYDPGTNVITPIAGRIIVVKCADGKYVKMEILSYYKNSPVAPTSSDIDRTYTFRYSYQPDGSKKLK